ncbi:MAG: hypothetical protein IPJ78_17320 [Gemmatimonadetes bacterium]|nr:hypothetical protein [Gemmatimonadota bacterium]
MANDSVLIDHAKITDGFGQLVGFVAYLAFESFCGICDDPIEVSAAEQKFLLEVKQVPVKMLLRGATFCARCRTRRAKINQLAQGERWRTIEGAGEELERLRAEESALMLESRNRSPGTKWPYRAA